MNNFKTLLKRELWEYRTLIVYLPFVITLFCIVLIIFALFKLDSLNLDTIALQERLLDDSKPFSTEMVDVRGIEGVASVPLTVKEYIYNNIYYYLGLPLWSALFLVIFFYFVQSLYQDRKDRTILFWKSMPVSDGLTVASKLITGLVIAPLITCLCVMLLQLAVLLIVSVYALNFTVDIWAVLWQPSHLFNRWFFTVVFLLFSLLWSLPIFTWVLLVSSVSRSIPFAWVVGIPVSLVLLQRVLTMNTSGGANNSSIVGGFVNRHLDPSWLFRGAGGFIDVTDSGIGVIMGRLIGLEFVVSITLSILFIVGAIKFRGRAGLL